MNLKITEKERNMIEVEIEGSRHTIPNLIRNALWEDSSVSLAAYEKEHPYVGNAKLIIKAKNPKKSLKDAIKRAQSEIKEFEKLFSKAVGA